MRRTVHGGASRPSFLAKIYWGVSLVPIEMGSVELLET